MLTVPRTHTLRTLREENSRLKDENLTLREELIRLQHIISALNNLQQSLDSITPDTQIQALLNNLLAAVLEAVDSQDGSLQLLDEEKQELVFVEVQGSSRGPLLGYRLPVSQGIAGWVVTHRTPELVPDVYQEPRFSPLVDQTTGFHTSSLICVPLLTGERTLGAIEVVNTRSGAPFTKKDLEVLELVARMATAALLRAESVGN